MTRVHILLALLGAFLLLPGLCGGFASIAMGLEHVSRGTLRFDYLEDLIWIVAVPSLNLGLVGMWILARSWQRPVVKAMARPVAVIALLLNLMAALFFLLPPNGDIATDLADTVVPPLIFFATFAIGGIACMRITRS